MDIESLTGEEAAQHIAEVARLRIAVFRDFPYLYDGDAAFEEEYLQTYLASPDAVIVLARDDGDIVGAATGLPLADETEEVLRPFRERGCDIGAIFYFGESVLLPAYRGRGVGVAFFEHREAHARRLGRFRRTCFCAVRRAPTDPRRPADYVPLDRFWQNRGYHPVAGLETTFSWKDLGAEEETPKPMQFWIRDLAP